MALRTALTLALIWAFCSGCETRQTHGQFARDATAIRSVLERQVQDWNRGDVEAFMSGYWRSDSLVFASGGKVTRGWKTVLDRYNLTYATPELMGKLTFDLYRVDPLGEGYAKVLGKWQVQRADTTLWGLFTLVFHRFPDGWKIIHDHTSSGT